MVKDLHALAGRGPYREVTRFVNRRISESLAFQPDDRFVDIGCGDGALLKLAIAKGIKTAVGFNATREEVDGFRGTTLDVRQGLSDSMSLPNGFATVVVCNSVLLIVPGEKIAASLREIARISQANARIWIGEIPRRQEPPNTPRHENVAQMLWWLLRKRGFRTFLGMCRRLLSGDQRGAVLFNPLAAIYWAEPEDFVRLAEDAGLRCERHFPHQTLGEDLQPCEHPLRHDYVFRKA